MLIASDCPAPNPEQVSGARVTRAVSGHAGCQVLPVEPAEGMVPQRRIEILGAEGWIG